MAIIFTKDISEVNFLSSHNNHVIEFYSDTALVVSSCNISIGATTFNIFPSPSNTFYFNFKDMVSSLINVVNYQDDLETALTTSTDTYTYEWSNRVYLLAEIVIKINFTNQTSETETRDVNFILSAANLRDYKKRFPLEISTANNFLLLPFKEGSNLTHYARYWDGYPYDIGIHIGEVIPGDDLEVLNETNGIDDSFVVTGFGRFIRLVFSDGRTDVSINDIIPIVDGYNSLKIFTALNPSYLDLIKSESCNDAVYLKWLNKQGGYSYWLFNYSETERRYKDLGDVFNDYNNLEDTTSPLLGLGKTSNDEINLFYDLANENDKNYLASLLDSPRVYLFTGTPFAQNNFNDFLEVKVKQNTFSIKDVKRDLYNIEVKIILPSNYNITV